MNISDLMALALASRALLAVWFQEGGLFAGRRMYFEARGGLAGKLVTCPFCLAVHVTSWLSLFTLAPAALLPGAWGGLFKSSLYVMAAISVVQILDRLWPVKEPVTFNSAELVPPEDPNAQVGNTDVRLSAGLPGVPGVREISPGPQGRTVGADPGHAVGA